VTLTALGEMFEAARSIMNWLGECAKVILSHLFICFFLCIDFFVIVSIPSTDILFTFFLFVVHMTVDCLT